MNEAVIAGVTSCWSNFNDEVILNSSSVGKVNIGITSVKSIFKGTIGRLERSLVDLISKVPNGFVLASKLRVFYISYLSTYQ